MKHLSIIVVSSMVLSCNPEPIPSEIIGNFEASEIMGPVEKLSLNESGEFHMEKWYSSCFGTADVDVASGSFVVNENWIVLKPTTSSRRYYEWDDINEKKLVWDSTSTISDMTSFNDSIYILRWNSRVYLLGGNAPDLGNQFGYFNSPLLEFLNDINTGATKTRRGQEHLLRGYWNQACESCTQSDLGKLLPSNWADHFLDSILVAETVKMEPILDRNRIDRYLVTISSGAEQGVRPGMIFYSNSVCPYSLSIVEVSKDISKGISYNTCEPKLGTALSTFTKKE